MKTEFCFYCQTPLPYKRANRKNSEKRPICKNCKKIKDHMRRTDYVDAFIDRIKIVKKQERKRIADLLRSVADNIESDDKYFWNRMRFTLNKKTKARG